MHTLQDETKVKLITELRGTYFPALGMQKYSAEFFYNQNEYKEYLQIMEQGKEATGQTYFIRKVLQYYKDNGLKATIKKVVKKIFS